ncbi:MAG: zinc transporter ZupT [Firmicutes bacterium]|nr:zinc transporter ZupT [Bacillota bacterium]
MDLGSILFAFSLTLFAGISAGIGGLFTTFCRKTNTKFLSFILGFSAGVMVYLSFMEILPEAKSFLVNKLGEPAGLWVTSVAFFGGVLIIAIIDKLIPSSDNPHVSHKIEEIQSCDVNYNRKRLLRTGLFTAFAITIHNFPEGIASFASALKDPALGIMIAIAIAIHNIPEGMAVSIPVFCATGSKKKAFLLSLASGLSEPLGALVGFLILKPFLNDIVFGILFAAVAGIMVYISFDELLPMAEEYGEHHLAILGLMVGMALMAISLILLII